MAGDPLYDALGVEPPQRRRSTGLGIKLALAAFAVAALGVSATLIPQPRHPGGDVAVVPIEPAPKPVPPPIAAAPAPATATVASSAAPGAAVAAAGTAATPSKAPQSPITVQPNGDTVEIQNGVKIVRLGGASAPGSVTIPVTAATSAGGLRRAPDPRLIERTRFGDLPRIGPDGLRPAEAYARPVPPGIPAGMPRIAILVGGMGLDQAATALAARQLPRAVSFGFAPYGADLPAQVSETREAGHEVILQLPMEPYDQTAAASLPHMLTVAAQAPETLDRLHWLMGRFTGYAGTASYLGAKFMADSQALRPVLRDIESRGLFFVDAGAAAGSQIGSTAPQGAQALKADVIVEATSDSASLQRALSQLESLARSKGSALAFIGNLAGNADAVAAFTESLESRGVMLVPVSALAERASTRGMSSAGP